MPRISRAVAVDHPHHITQRGNYRQIIFETDKDYLTYHKWLNTYSHKYSLSIWAYCLMGNHVHFIAIPKESDSLARTFNTLHMRYAQYINEKHKAHGHLWQGRFFSTVLDDKHLYAAIRYVENNPVRAKIVQRADDYRWSSARRHVRGVADPVLSDECYLIKEIPDWNTYLEDREDKVLIDAIRKNTMTGRPCGDDSFIAKIEKLLGRRLAALPCGRPRITK